ncbi:hypothetical protein [Desertibacillus haloalkaliphilus]|uniref:hypothetical protein n=1 Tax=Desertibacillus haloalkaliphilus TaxID=1328930 RepID=UPI001C26FF88|nr:hypothetical protein [Desertibacillus haloalkaliphilus]MBU8905233.1 hypothetical protein [Desertibacillus haloalkaliphilus]
MKWIKIVVIMTVSMMFLVACNVSEEEALLASEQVFNESFTVESNQANLETEQLSLYVPRGVTMTEETTYNILLEKGNQVFLLFFNPVEPLTSTVHMERDAELRDEALLFETYESDEKRGYLLVLEEDDEKKVNTVVGLGGAKISTITAVKDLEESVEIMTDILHSIKYEQYGYLR